MHLKFKRHNHFLFADGMRSRRSSGKYSARHYSPGKTTEGLYHLTTQASSGESQTNKTPRAASFPATEECDSGFSADSLPRSLEPATASNFEYFDPFTPMVLAWTNPHNVDGDSSIEDIVSERVKEKFQRSSLECKRMSEGSLGEARVSELNEGRLSIGSDVDVRSRHRVASHLTLEAESSETDMPHSTTSSIRGSSTDVWTSSSDHSATESETENEDRTSQRSTATSGSTEEEWAYYVEAAKSRVEPEPDDFDMEEDIAVDDFRWLIRNMRMAQPETIEEEVENADTTSTVSSQLKLDDRLAESKHEKESPRTVILAMSTASAEVARGTSLVDSVVRSEYVSVSSSKVTQNEILTTVSETAEAVGKIPDDSGNRKYTLELESDDNDTVCAKKLFPLERHTEVMVASRRRHRRRNSKNLQLSTETSELSSSLPGDSPSRQTGGRVHGHQVGSGDWLYDDVQTKLAPQIWPEAKGDHAHGMLFETFDISAMSRAVTHHQSLIRHLSLEELFSSSDKMSSTHAAYNLPPKISAFKRTRIRRRPHSAPAKLSGRTRKPVSTTTSTELSGGDDNVTLHKQNVTEDLTDSDVNTEHISREIKALKQDTISLASATQSLRVIPLQETVDMYLESARATTEHVSPSVGPQLSPTGAIPHDDLPLPVNYFASYREVTPEEKCIAYTIATSQLDSATDQYKETCSVPDGQARLEWLITEGTAFQVDRMMSGAAQLFGESPNLPFLVENSADKLKSATFDTDYDGVSSVSSFSYSSSSAESFRARSNTDASLYSDPADVRNEDVLEVSRVPSYLSFGSPSAAIAVSNQRQELYQNTRTSFSAAFLPKTSRHAASDEDLYPSFVSIGTSDKGPRVSKAVRKPKRTRSFSPVSRLGQRGSKDIVRRRIIGPSQSGGRPKSADCEALFALDSKDVRSKSDQQK